MPLFSPQYRRLTASVMFYDARLTKRMSSLYQSMVKSKTCVIRRLSAQRSDCMGYYRFLQNKRASVEDILTFLSQRTCAGLQTLKQKHVLVVGDTTEISLKKQQASLLDKSLVGTLSDNKTPGFLAHVNMAIDAEDGRGHCLSDVQIWTRQKREEAGSYERDTRLPNEKESYRWIEGLRRSVALLEHTRCRTFIFDREADMINLFFFPRDHQTHLIVRSHYNRSIIVDGSPTSMQEYLQDLPVLGTYPLNIDLSDRKNLTKRTYSDRRARIAQMSVRAGAFDLALSKDQQLTYWMVDAIEQPLSVPAGEEPIHWRLITSHPSASFAQARQIIGWYEKRWMIEQLFRVFKKQGIGLEDSQLKYATAIQKLCVVALYAAFDVMRLTLARGNPQGQPCEEVFCEQQQQCLEKICPTLEGNTAKQKNPYPRSSLSWAAWIIARLGGWDGYQSQRPPGPITFKRGIDTFYTYFNAWIIFSSQ
jgi:Transposase DNA-binding